MNNYKITQHTNNRQSYSTMNKQQTIQTQQLQHIGQHTNTNKHANETSHIQGASLQTDRPTTP